MGTRGRLKDRTEKEMAPYRKLLLLPKWEKAGAFGIYFHLQKAGILIGVYGSAVDKYFIIVIAQIIIIYIIRR